LERYGAENPFSKEASTFEKVQAASKENHVILTGADNPFSKPEVKEKIRQYWQKTYGVNGPQQVPEIREATRATNLGRYGVEEPLSSPVRREAIRATCERVYGGPAPSCSPVVKEKQRQTNLAHYGVEWTNQDPDVRRRQLETMEANYGGHYFASEQGKKVIRDALLERYGVENAARIEGNWEKTVATFIRKYGVSHPLQLPELQEKQRATRKERHGYDYFIGTNEFFLSCLKNAGVSVPEVLPTPLHPMKVREFAQVQLHRMTRPGPNLLEQRVGKMCPTMQFTGDGKFWRWLPKLKHHKNPDFIFPGPDPTNPKKGVTKVCEVFGNFWHSRLFTGKAPFEHEQELIEAYAEVGITCLVLWESEVKSDPKGTAERLLGFLGG